MTQTCHFNHVLDTFDEWASQHVPQYSYDGYYTEGGEWVYRHNIVNLMYKCWKAAIVSNTK